MADSLVFISYKRQDKRFARRVKEKLENTGEFLAWIDTEKVKTGDDWKRTIDLAISESFAVLVIITPEALKSQYVTYEWSYAMGLGKRIIPLVLKEPDPKKDGIDIHPKLHPQQMQVLYFTDSRKYPWSQLIQELLEAKREELIPPQVLAAATILEESIEPQQHRIAFEALRVIDHPKSVDVLLKVTESLLPRVRIEAGFELLRKVPHDERVIPVMQEVLRTDASRADSAGVELVQMNSRKAAEAMYEVWKVGKSDRREEQMAGFESPDTIPILCQVFRESEQVSKIMLNSLCRHDDPMVQKALLDKLQHLPPKQMENKILILQTIARIGDSSYIPALTDIALDNIKQVQAQENEVAIQALTAIESIGGIEALTALERISQEHRANPVMGHTILSMQTRIHNKLPR